MARGWESKSVESQQADREHRPAPPASAASVAAGDAARRARAAMLRLAQTRARADLAVARHPAHRSMLEAAIAALDAQLRESEP